MSHSRVRGPAEHTHPCRHHHIQLIPFCSSKHPTPACPGCPGGLHGILARGQSWPSPGSFTHVGTSGGRESSSSALALAQLQGFTSPQGPVGPQPPCRKHNTDPNGPCPSPHPSRAPCWDSGRAGHVHRVPGGDTRPVSLPSFHSLQEMMNLCLAQAALVELGTSEHSGIWVGSPAFPGSAAARAVTGVEHHHIPPQRPVGHWSSCPSPLAVQTQPEQLPITARLN